LKDFARAAVDRASSCGASYADCRVIERLSQDIVAKNGELERMATGRDYGWGVRVIVDGGWGFASTFRFDPPSLESTVKKACEIARATASLRKRPVRLAPAPVVQAAWATPIVKDPFRVDDGVKASTVIEASKVMMQPKVRAAQAMMAFLKETKTLATSEGSLVEQVIYESSASIQAFATDGREVQRRTYPNSIFGDVRTEGYEHIEKVDIVRAAPRIASEAVELLSVPQCPAGTTTIILDPTQLALQLHESGGHPMELDRVLNHEADFAGTSFLGLDKLGTFRYGSHQVNITADATLPGGRGTFAYDDDGVAAQRTELVKRGILVGYMSSRETAGELGWLSTGANRADGWGRIPIVRMTNVCLEPGEWTLEDLIADTDDGLYLHTNKSWSIDDRRLNFQFGTEVGYVIKNGRIVGTVKNPVYTGITYQFWGGCDAVCDRSDWHVYGFPCGKATPGQNGHVGHGTSHARFRNVVVGVKA